MRNKEIDRNQILAQTQNKKCPKCVKGPLNRGLLESSRPQLTEEIFEQCGGTRFGNAAIDFRRVMACGRRKKPDPVLHRAPLFVRCAEIEAADARERDCCSTHR